jgi:DNA-binding HxlR family transcriptional regulator
MKRTGDGGVRATSRDPAVARLHDLVHQPARLGILTVLTETNRADFPYLKATLGLTDGNLGRHLEVLAEAGLVTITKGYEGRRPRTWAEITKAGRGALAAQVAAMKEIVERYESAKLAREARDSAPGSH